MIGTVIEKTKFVYTVYTNTDCTEGRGAEYPIGHCELLETAERIGRKKYVQGSNCPIHKQELPYIGRQLYAPTTVERPSPEDIRLKAQRDKEAAIKAEQDREKIKLMLFQQLDGSTPISQELEAAMKQHNLDKDAIASVLNALASTI